LPNYGIYSSSIVSGYVPNIRDIWSEISRWLINAVEEDYSSPMRPNQRERFSGSTHAWEEVKEEEDIGSDQEVFNHISHSGVVEEDVEGGIFRRWTD